jgi:hypothetical protein
MKPAKIKSLQAEGKKLAVRIIAPARPHEPYMAIVESRSHNKLGHLVMIKFERDGRILTNCTCPWSEHGGIGCCHVIAALDSLASRKRSKLSFWLTPEEARRQKKRVFRITGVGNGEDLWVTSRSLV